jgi:hypothetical protein
MQILLDSIERTPNRVPVLFTLGKWSPEHADVEAWMVDELRQSPALASYPPAVAPALAAQSLGRCRI